MRKLKTLLAIALVASFLVSSFSLIQAQPPSTGPYVRFTPQGLSSLQQAQARANLGLGTAALLNSKTDVSDTYQSQNYKLNKPSIVTLVGAQPDEATPICTSCTVVLDTSATSTRLNSRGWKVSTSGAVTAQISQTYGSAVYFGPASAIGMWVYIDPADVGKITQIVIDIFLNSGQTISWQRSQQNSTTPFVSGWNLLRWSASAGTTLANLQTYWGSTYRVRTLIVTNAAIANTTIAQVWAEVWPKAQIVFIEDRGYKTFLNSFYPQLKSRNIPVTFCLDPATLGTSPGTDAEVITESDVLSVGRENRNEVSYHGWDGSTTASMTADQLRTDSMKAIKWLTPRGFGPVIWRCAFVQNSATNASFVQPYHLFLATSTSGSSFASAWPPISPYSIDRYALHGQTTTAIDDLFSTLQVTHGFTVLYTHGVQTLSTSANDITPTLRDYILSKIDTAQTAGWLAGTTVGELWRQDGGRAERGAVGENYLVWRDATGTSQTVRVP